MVLGARLEGKSLLTDRRLHEARQTKAAAKLAKLNDDTQDTARQTIQQYRSLVDKVNKLVTYVRHAAYKEQDRRHWESGR